MSDIAFLAIIEQNQGIIYKICRLYRNHDQEREDLFQEITFQLWKAYPAFRGEAKVTTWLYRIALNTAMASFRKKQPELSFVAELPDTAAAEMNNIEDRQEQLFTAIKSLNEADRAIVTLYLEEMSYQQIAEIIGISENNVGVKLNRIKEKIKKLIKS